MLAAGFVGFFSAVVLAAKNAKNAKEQDLKLQEAEHLKASRKAAAELIKKVAQGFHSLTWILWIAKHTPEFFEAKHVPDHDKGMNKLYSEIAGSQIMLAAYSKELYENTADLVNLLYAYDGKVATITPLLYDPSTKDQGTTDFGDLWAEVYLLSMDIPKNFSSKLESLKPVL